MYNEDKTALKGTLLGI
jgi:hypothetical protein